MSYVIDADKSVDPIAAAELADLMVDISEECYCAYWMTGLEAQLWSMVHGAERRCGHAVVTQLEIDTLRGLHEKCGGWIVWHSSDDDVAPYGERFVTTSDWLKMAVVDNG